MLYPVNRKNNNMCLQLAGDEVFCCFVSNFHKQMAVQLVPVVSLSIKVEGHK